jgi:hypothetical protein
MEPNILGDVIKITMDTLIAFVALLVSIASLGISVSFWRKSFRPIVTAMVKTHSAGNDGITYDLVLLNSGAIPAKNITLKANDSSLVSAFGGDATSDNKRRWLACFAKDMVIPILHNGDRISCSFGNTRAADFGFWKYKAPISIVIEYSGWFGIEYRQSQELIVIDSDSFTGFMWANK